MDSSDTTIERPMKYPKSDKRVSSRGLIIQVTPIMVGHELQYFFGYAKNISRSGICIHTLIPLKVGEEFEIGFTLPNTEVTINCHAKVVWNRSSSNSTRVSREGLHFVDITPEQARKIDEWVKDQEEI